MRQNRLYSLFRVTRTETGRKRYERISHYAFPKAQAVRIYQGLLLDGAATGDIKELRPIKEDVLASLEREENHV